MGLTNEGNGALVRVLGLAAAAAAPPAGAGAGAASSSAGLSLSPSLDNAADPRTGVTGAAAAFGGDLAAGFFAGLLALAAGRGAATGLEAGLAGVARADPSEAAFFAGLASGDLAVAARPCGFMPATVSSPPEPSLSETTARLRVSPAGDARCCPPRNSW